MHSLYSNLSLYKVIVLIVIFMFLFVCFIYYIYIYLYILNVVVYTDYLYLYLQKYSNFGHHTWVLNCHAFNIYERRAYTVIDYNSTNINKTNNHRSHQIIEHKKPRHNNVNGFHQTVNTIPDPLLIIGQQTPIQI